MEANIFMPWDTTSYLEAAQADAFLVHWDIRMAKFCC